MSSPAVLRARQLASLQRWADAAEAARAGLVTDADHPILLDVLAISLSNLGKHDEAVQTARRRVETMPNDAAGLATLGVVSAAAKRTDEAIAHLRRAVELDPRQVDAHVWLTEALITKAYPRRSKPPDNRLLDAAAVHARRVMELRPDLAAGDVLFARLALTRGHFGEARHLAESALAKEPGHPGAHVLLGLATQVAGDHRGASEHYVTAGRLSSDAAHATHRLRHTGEIPRAAVVTVLALFVGLAVVGDQLGGGPVSLVIGVVAVGALLAGFFLWLKRHRRRQLSDDARAVLERDDQLRPRRVRNLFE